MVETCTYTRADRARILRSTYSHGRESLYLAGASADQLLSYLALGKHNQVHRAERTRTVARALYCHERVTRLLVQLGAALPGRLIVIESQGELF